MANKEKFIQYIGVNFNDKKYRLVLENCIPTYGHGDSYTFQADFYIRDNNTGEILLDGKVWNDGWGGPNQFSYSQPYSSFEELNNIMKSCFTFPCGAYTIEYGIDEISSTLAELYNESNNCGIYTEKAVYNFISKI